MKSVQDVPVLVTGGGSGLGEAVARHFAGQGARVGLLDIDMENAKRVANEIDAVPIACDVGDAQSAEEAIAKSTKEIGVARVLVNCAGIVAAKRIVGPDGPADLELYARVIQVNLIGTFNLMRLAAHGMQSLEPVTPSGERGVIVNTASIAGLEGQIGQAAYASSKAGIVGLTLPAARELARFGIRVMAIAPGLCDTPMAAQVPPELRKSLESAVPFPSRFVQPEEFAQLTAHIVSNEMLNGEVIRLDGGVRLPVQT